MFGFLGPSGAGKTTTIKLLTRQLTPDAGQITVLGRDVTTFSIADYQNIDILTDNSGLYERLSVWDNLMLIAGIKGLPASQVEAVLADVGLAQHQNQRAKTLSKGMKQRVILARAILYHPSFYIWMNLPPLWILPMLSHFVLNMVTAMTLALIPTSFLAMLVAEEKEKNTLRTLMLSGVTAVAFITSKILLTLLLVEAVSILCFMITGTSTAVLPIYLLFVTLGSLGLLLLGATIGLLCKDQMSTGVLATPIALVLLLPPMLGGMNDFLAAIAVFTPIEWVMRMTSAAAQGQSLFTSQGLTAIGVLLAWVVLPGLLFGFVYRFRQLDA